jgi:hypothetical protein
MNDETDILYPVFALVGLTLAVLVILGFARIGGLLTGRLPPEFYKLFRERDDQEPDHLRALARNFQNLLEVPMLFYLGCVTAYVTHAVTEILIVLAWLFVGVRFIHTAIHITYNAQWHRTSAFVVSSLVLIGFWIELALQVVETPR